MSLEMPCVFFSDGKCAKFSEPGYVPYCGYSPCGFDVPSNADRIRAMSDEELAATEMLCPYWASKTPWRCPKKYAKRKDGKEGYDCVACVLDWLKAPVEE